MTKWTERTPHKFNMFDDFRFFGSTISTTHGKIHSQNAALHNKWWFSVFWFNRSTLQINNKVLHWIGVVSVVNQISNYFTAHRINNSRINQSVALISHTNRNGTFVQLQHVHVELTCLLFSNSNFLCLVLAGWLFRRVVAVIVRHELKIQYVRIFSIRYAVERLEYSTDTHLNNKTLLWWCARTYLYNVDATQKKGTMNERERCSATEYTDTKEMKKMKPEKEATKNCIYTIQWSVVSADWLCSR